MIDKTNIVSDSDFSFIIEKLNENFKIDKEFNTVIFGPNGIGKTSLYKYSQKNTSDKSMYLDYLENKETFIKNKRTIVINPFYGDIENLTKEVVAKKEAMSVTNKIKSNFNIRNARQAKEIHEQVGEYYQKDDIVGLTITANQIDNINNQVININPAILVMNHAKFKELNDVNEELQKYDDSVLFRSLKLIDKLLQEDSEKCPVCDADNRRIKEIVTNKITSLQTRKSELINEIIQNNATIDINETLLTSYQSAAEALPDNLIGDYSVCFGDKDRLNELNTIVEERNVILEEITGLTNRQEALYNLIKNEEDLFKDELNRFLEIPINDINFDAEKKEVTIKLARNIETYSTGEINYLSFLIRIYEFISSDNEYLILDDPISSLDLVNHYRMTYELVKRASEDKKIIILTHSVELLNTINSQHRGHFKFYYLEQYNDELHIDEIINYDDNIITLSNIQNNVDDSKLIEAIIKREEDYSREENKIFHFNNFENVDNYPELTNLNFIEFIDNFNDINKSDDFLENSFLKIKTIVALRVWLEHEMWAGLNDDHKVDYLALDTLGERIGYYTRINSLPNLRTKLMKSKVMLNQGSHYQSQIMPFAYAIHISLDDLKYEVERIKNIFS